MLFVVSVRIFRLFSLTAFVVWFVLVNCLHNIYYFIPLCLAYIVVAAAIGRVLVGTVPARSLVTRAYVVFQVNWEAVRIILCLPVNPYHLLSLLLVLQ